MKFFIKPRLYLVALAGALLACAPSADSQAGQQLIATPYPEMLAAALISAAERPSTVRINI